MDDDLQLAVTAAQWGGQVLLSHFWKGLLARLDKGHLDIATQADIESEDAIRRVLAQSSVRHPLSSERGLG